MLFLQSTGDGLPLWVIILLATLPILGTAFGVILNHYFNRPKTNEEIAGQKLQNEKQALENKDAKGDLLDEAELEISELRRKNRELAKQKHALEIDVESFEITKAKLEGKIEMAEQQKEDAILANEDLKERNKRLHEENVKEKEICQEQILKVMKKLEELEKYLRENNIQLPAELDNGTT